MEWLTTAVGVRGLRWAILQTVQDLPFAHVAVSNQQKLEKVVVALDRAALAAHPDPQQGRQKQRCSTANSSWPQGDRHRTPTLAVLVKTTPIATSFIPFTLWGGVFKTVSKCLFVFFTIKSSADTNNVLQRWEHPSPPKDNNGNSLDTRVAQLGANLMSTTGIVYQTNDWQVINRCKNSLRLRFLSEPKSHHPNSGLTSIEEEKQQ